MRRNWRKKESLHGPLSRQSRKGMKFKLDENLPNELALVFRNAGHDAVTVVDQGLSGAKAPDLITPCRLEGRALITLDTDFSDIRAYQPSAHSGIVVFGFKVSCATTFWKSEDVSSRNFQTRHSTVNFGSWKNRGSGSVIGEGQKLRPALHR
jgi:hypothetical protein